MNKFEYTKENFRKFDTQAIEDKRTELAALRKKIPDEEEFHGNTKLFFQAVEKHLKKCADLEDVIKKHESVFNISRPNLN